MRSFLKEQRFRYLVVVRKLREGHFGCLFWKLRPHGLGIGVKTKVRYCRCIVHYGPVVTNETA